MQFRYEVASLEMTMVMKNTDWSSKAQFLAVKIITFSLNWGPREKKW